MPDCRVRVDLILIVLCLHTQLIIGQDWVQTEQPKPVIHRLRHLDEQFRRFQEVTLMRLSDIAANYNISYNIDVRFQELMEQYQSISDVLKEFQTMTANDLKSLKFWMTKLQKKTKKMEVKVIALEKAVDENGKAVRKDIQKVMLSNLTRELQVHKEQISMISAHSEQLQSSLRTLRDSIRKQEKKISRLEKRLWDMFQAMGFHHFDSGYTPPVTSARQEEDPRSPHPIEKLLAQHSKGRKSKADQVPLTAMPEAAAQEEPELRDVPQLPLRHRIPHQQHTSRRPGTICNVKSMLLFPSASIQNYVTFRKGFPSGIHELSMCTWLRLSTPYMGTLLSYATEDNDNKLILYGRNSSQLNSMDFVIGDPSYRQLPTAGLLGGDWHHLCVIWSAAEGRFWQYVDRRLTSAGSRFQKGYEIPPGGSLVMGQEQDSVGGDFDAAEAFVGRVAGFALWDRVLSPGEVSAVTTGKSLPREPILTMDDVDQLNGSVQLVDCACLEHCT
uniref:Pentraxin 4, long n=1 Tax=Paramormyrops kingsleyae TaxID=1676925 RepID=A0A3B3THP0_9TELE|nr:pentraxin-4 [Paramormyrops kingsleyae]